MASEEQVAINRLQDWEGGQFQEGEFARSPRRQGVLFLFYFLNSDLPLIIIPNKRTWRKKKNLYLQEQKFLQLSKS